MNSNITIDSKLSDIINTASKYNCITRVGVFGSYARGDFKEASDVNLLYDYDETSVDSKEELLEYIEYVDMLVRHTLHASKADFVWYRDVLNSKNTQFKKSVLNKVLWIFIR
ncbi:MAG: nucleotidyltransferase domain-containing protein [Oscillospiraceae bacterium]|nr:nucleotidyltransferase domain-containing protein [Oscillospiraceae bacterium]